MKHKFKIGDLVKYKTQIRCNEPFMITAKGFMQTGEDKQNIYHLRNSEKGCNYQCEEFLEKYDKIAEIEKEAELFHFIQKLKNEPL